MLINGRSIHMIESENPLFSLRIVYQAVTEGGVGVDALIWHLRDQVDADAVKKCLSVLVTGNFLWCPVPDIYRRVPLE